MRRDASPANSLSPVAIGLLGLLLAGLLMAGCTTSPPPMPTVADISAEGTAQYLTRNAPPPGFERSVQFSKIDSNLDQLPSSRYIVSLTFDGVYSGTQNKVKGSIQAEVFTEGLSGTRRVILKSTGEIFGAVDRNVEGVRISNDYYLVDQNKTCTKVTEQSADRQVADLTATGLIGGVKKATPLGERKAVGRFQIWEYTFLPDDVIVPPTVKLSQGGKLTVAAGDLWVVPASNAVYEYTITLNVENALLQSTRQLTGQIRGSYQLVETGGRYNIAVPFGC
jgi:hypothetical protein